MESASSSVMDKQVRKTFALKSSIFASNRLLFHMPLSERLASSFESKCLWLPDHLQPQSSPPQFPSVLAHIIINDVPITSKLQKWICGSYNSSNLQPIPNERWDLLFHPWMPSIGTVLAQPLNTNDFMPRLDL
jgi:hypothetical protein